MSEEENNTKYRARKNNTTGENTSNNSKQQQDSGQKAAHTAGKGAATYFGGPVGGKLYDAASKTKLGQALEKGAGKAINKNPTMRRASQVADKSGALDAANKGMDAMGGAKGAAAGAGAGTSTGSTSAPKDPSMQKEGIKREGLEDKEPSAQNSKKNSLFPGSKDNNSPNENINDENSSGSAALNGFVKKHWKFLLPIAGYAVGLLLIIVAILGVIGVILGPAQTVINFFGGIWDDLKELVGYKSDEEWELEYYETLEKVQDEFAQKYNVCIDVNLITATLTVNMLNDDYLEEGIDSEDPDGAELTYNHDYRKMTKQIELLANMQIRRKVYLLDKEWKTTNPYTGEEIQYCSNPETESEEVTQLIKSEEDIKKAEYRTGFASFLDNWLSKMGDSIQGVPIRISSSPREVAQNDLDGGLFQWFTKKANEERNIAYYLYRPPFTVQEYDSEGNKLTTPKVECTPRVLTSNTSFAEVDIGDLEHMEESVYYWNLMDSFIGDYYADYLPSGSGAPQEGTDRYEKIKGMIEDIYLLYNEMGPSRNCDFSYRPSVSGSCPNGVTVTGGEYAGTYDLEEYVAGVVEAEMYSDFNIEAKKALAVAARTYVLNRTNYCESPIENSSRAQNFNPNYSDESWEAASSTAGEVLTYNGEIFSSEYDSWDCQGSNTCTYVKLPNRENNEITISDKYLSRAAGGHGRGMSQIAAADMAASSANTGNTYYRTILSTFYSEGVEISVLGGSGSSLDPSIVNGSKDEKLKYLFPDGLPTSSSEMSRYLTTISITAPDATGTNHTFTTQVHKAVASDIQNAMQEIVNAGFPINSFYCYSWRGMAGNRNTTSHHSYGVACDINPTQNYMIRNGQVISGSYWKPGEDPYSITPNGIVVTTFAKYGWIWGGNWSSSKDYMHFSFTGY
jgi:fibronectin type III domain